MQERIGVIDLGSNTTRLVVMGYTPHHSFRLLDEVRETVRLAEGVGDDGQLQPVPMERGVEAMKMFHSYCKSTGVTRIVPVATSATRDAANQSAFLGRVAQESGLKLRVLSTEEEAYYGYLGAVNALDLRDGFLIDIGGGSAEVTAIRGRGFVRSFSQPAGCVRFSERYVRSDPISNRDFKALQEAATSSFGGLDWLANNGSTTLAGIGGTIRTLAEIDQKLSGYPLDRVHGHTFSRARLDEIIELLRPTTLRQRADFPGLVTAEGKPWHYLDTAATAQKPHAVIDAVAAYIVLRKPLAEMQRAIGLLFIGMVGIDIGFSAACWLQPGPHDFEGYTMFNATLGWLQWACLASWGVGNALGSYFVLDRRGDSAAVSYRDGV